MPVTVNDLVALCRILGEPSNDFAILAEGNASAKIDRNSFYVKASGAAMRDITADGIVEVRFAPIQEALDSPTTDDIRVREILSQSRSNLRQSAIPSVETFMHGYLLNLPEVAVVGHTHPTPVISLLCIEDAKNLVSMRLFPDQVVCCGPASCFVPYTDPGIPLANSIRSHVTEFMDRHLAVPKVIYLENHGLIALGKSNREVESTTAMAAKSARVLLDALSTGRAIRPLSALQIDRIHTRPDEHHRQRVLWESR